MNKKRVILTSLLAVMLMLIVISIASSQTFVLTKETTSLNTCPGSTLLVKTNVASADSGSFTVSQSGSASQFTITVPTGFILSSGETKTLFSYVTPPSTTQKGVYNLQINVNSQGVSKTADYSIIVEDCRSASLQIETQKQICPGELATFKATLTNSGRYTEEYNMIVQGPAKEWSTLSDSFVRLDAGQSKEIFVYVQPSQDKIGTYDFTLTASSASRAYTSSKANVNVLACYDYILTSEKALHSLCESGKLTVPLTLENKGTVSNTYKLSLSAPNFVTLEKNSVNLAPSQSANINLILSPSFGISGDFPVKITITSDYGKVSKALPLTARVEKCYNTQVEIAQETATLCSSFKSEQEVIIKNTGKYDNTFTLSLVGEDFASLNKASLTLAPNEEKSVTLILAPKQETISKTYNIQVISTDSVSKASASDTIKVSVVSEEQCFLPVITLSQNSVEVPKDSAAAISFTLENKGKENAPYIIELNGNALSFVQVNPSSLTLEPGKSETIFLHISPGIAVSEGNYNIGITARVKDSQITASNNLEIKVLPQAQVPIIIPGQETQEQTPWERIKAFFMRIFGISASEQTQETQEQQEVEETQEQIQEEEPETIQEQTQPTETITQEQEPVPEQIQETQPEETTEVQPETTPLLTGLSVKQFVKDYAYHLVAALILIILIIIIATGYWKKIVDFFVEEESPVKNTKNNKK